MTTRLVVAGLGWLAIGLWAPHASGQNAAAEALFEQGRTLMEAGDYDDACPKLAESYRIDPASGTLLNLGLCHEKAGRLATAWATYKDAATFARRDNHPARVAFAERKISSIEPVLSYLTVAVNSSARVRGLELRVDGNKLGEGAWNTAIPTDPGEHRLEASAAGHTPWSKQFSVGREGDHVNLAVPQLEAETAGPSTTLVNPPANASTSTPSQPKARPATPRTAQGEGKSVLPAVSLWTGVGCVALGLGAGALAMAAKGSLDDQCNAGECPSTAKPDHDALVRWGTVSTVGIGLGVVLVGAGIWGMSAEEPEQARGISVGVSGNGATVQGRWRFQ